MKTPPAPVLVGMGGALGALTRAAVAQAVPHEAGTWPTATWTTNVVGCFAIGIALAILVERESQAALWARPLLVAGFLGGFTTFSTFSVEIVDLLTTQAMLAALYVAGSLVGGVAAVAAGKTVTRWALGIVGPTAGVDLAAEDEA